MSYFRRVKDSHVFVTPVKNSFDFCTCVTNTCDFFTCVTDSFECESQTNLSHVWKIRAYLSHLWTIRAIFSQMRQIRANPSLLWRTRTNFSHLLYVRMTCLINFRKKSNCNTFIFTAAYLPNHIRLFLRRLVIGRTQWASFTWIRQEISDEMRQQEKSKMADGGHNYRRTGILLVLAQLDTEGNILTKF